MLRRICAGIAILIAFAPTARADGTGSELLAVQFELAQSNTQIVLLLARSAPFRAAIVDGSRRLELIFPSLAAAPPVSAGAGSGGVRSFSTEALPDGALRVVFELAAPAMVRSAVTQSAGFGSTVRTVVTLAPVMARPLAKVAAAPPQLDRVAIAPGRKAPPAVATVASATASKPPPAPGVSAINAAKRVIVVDPGHGGVDPGAASVAGYQEKEITLATAREVKRMLEATGRYKVILTRNADVYLKLRERVAEARAAHGDLFVSLHADSIASRPLIPVAAERPTRGASVYTLSETASDTEAERYAQRENRADLIGNVSLRDQSDDVANILVDLTVREAMNGGNRFAGILMAAMEENGVSLLPRAPHRSAGFAVLKSPDIPSALIEMGYLSDIGDAHNLADPAYRTRIARALTEGIDRYFAAAD